MAAHLFVKAVVLTNAQQVNVEVGEEGMRFYHSEIGYSMLDEG
jgi:hypothetical protein